METDSISNVKLIINDCETLKYFALSVKESVYAMFILQYYALFCSALKEYINQNLLSSKNDSENANLRNMIKNYEKRFGKTPLSWQQALKGRTGVVCLNIPTRYVLDRKNPWIPFVNIQSATSGMFFMDAKKCLDAIKQQEKQINSVGK